MNQPPLFKAPSLTVTELTRYLRNLVDSDEVLRDVWVEGEVSNLSRPTSGHLYFTLKDGGAALKCVIWRSTALRLRFGLQNGLAIDAHGAISVYERDGQYQLYVEAIRPAGEGLLFQEFMRLKNRLETEGLFDEERKRPIPERPVRIGIVTSPTGAALQDMLNTLRNRYPLAEVFVSPCAVQGESAPGEIVKAMSRLYKQARPDVVIVARGGGSLEDLWAFNDEWVVRAIAAAPVPVITGVGHETDFTLADFAADLRAPTPTGAAVLSTPDRIDLLSELRGMQSRLETAMLGTVEHLGQDLTTLRYQLEHVSPGRRIQSERQGLDSLEQRGSRAFHQALKLHRAQLNGLHSRLEALSPTAILQRGFALVQRADGRWVGKASETRAGETVDVQMQDGKLTTRVEQVQVIHRPGSIPGEGA